MSTKEAQNTIKLKWEEIKTDGDVMAVGKRSSHGCSVFNETLYLFGGEKVARTPIDDAALYCLPLKERTEEGKCCWKRVETKTDDVPPPRVAHAQAVVGSVLYIFGGRQGITMDESPLSGKLLIILMLCLILIFSCTCVKY
jgi:hypothetical protein